MIEIKCINKQPRDNYWERITHVGGMSTNGVHWKFTQEEVISIIESGKYSFYVNVGGNKVNVIVAKSRFENKYIKTEADDKEPNNLLSLPECKSQ